ncbi:MAG: hypothetical protein FWH21_03975 [Kiritimatiellaeota bacterium]|nr:hypothetical protein [Kiritimatiellota bacterium]
MKETLILLAILVTVMNAPADSSIITDLKEYNRLGQHDPATPFTIERFAQMDKIQDRVTPLIRQEYATLTNGEVTPILRELLSDSEVMGFCLAVLNGQLSTYPADIQADILKKVFLAAPDSQRWRVLQLLLMDFPKTLFSGEDIQQWLVKKINGGMPGGAFYFILTEESADAVSKAATASMKRFSKSRGHNETNILSLLSVVFLASRGDENAINLLDSLLEQRDINSLLDMTYVIPAAAMSGNEKLIKKIRDIILTDKRNRYDGGMPLTTSFAQEAAASCALTIEGFPKVGRWNEYDEGIKKKVHGWLKDNPTHKVKLENPCVFFRETCFQCIIPAMRRTYEGE